MNSPVKSINSEPKAVENAIDALPDRASDRTESIEVVERLRGNLADFNEKHLQDLYQNRLDGPIASHILIQNY